MTGQQNSLGWRHRHDLPNQMKPSGKHILIGSEHCPAMPDQRYAKITDWPMQISVFPSARPRPLNVLPCSYMVTGKIVDNPSSDIPDNPSKNGQDGGDGAVEVSPRDIVYTQPAEDAIAGKSPKQLATTDLRWGTLLKSGSPRSRSPLQAEFWDIVKDSRLLRFDGVTHQS